MLFIHMLCLVCFDVFHVLCMCVPDQARRKLSKSDTANTRHENLVHTKEVGCYMNIKANAEHTAYYYAAGNILVCQEGYKIVYHHYQIVFIPQALKSIILSVLLHIPHSTMIFIV